MKMYLSHSAVSLLYDFIIYTIFLTFMVVLLFNNNYSINS